jgi:hypothetical protein
MHDAGRIAKDLTAPLSTVGRWLKAIGLGRLRCLQKNPVAEGVFLGQKLISC